MSKQIVLRPLTALQEQLAAVAPHASCQFCEFRSALIAWLFAADTTPCVQLPQDEPPVRNFT